MSSQISSTPDATIAEHDGTYRPAYQAVAEQLVDFIRAGGYHPGDRLPTESELARRLAVGRSIVREALKILSAVGLVQTRRGSGTYVGNGTSSFLPMLGTLPATTDPQQVGRLFEFRLIQETAAARMAAEHITVKALRRLENALAENHAGLERDDPVMFQRGDRDFHVIVAEASGNPFLAATLRQVMDLQIWAVALIVGEVDSRLSVAAEQHQAIFDAVRAGSPDQAADAAELHVGNSRSDYDRAVRRILDDRLR